MSVIIPRPVLRASLIVRLVLVLLLVLAWALRLYHLGTMSIWWDESLSWDRAIGDISTILANRIDIQTVATRDLHPPLYFLLLHFAVLAAGTTEFALRILSTFANLLTLALFYPLAQLLFGQRGRTIGLLTIFFAALSPLYVWYSQEARPYGLVLCFSVAALYALLRWLKTKPTHFRDLFSRWGIAFFVLLAANLVTLYLAFVLLPFFALVIWLYNESPASPLVSRFWQSKIENQKSKISTVHKPYFGETPISNLQSQVFSLQSLPSLISALLLLAFVIILVLLPRGDAIASWEQAGPTFVPLFIMLRDVWNSFVVGVTASLDVVGLLDLALLGLWLVGVFSTIRTKPRDGRLALLLLGYILVPALSLQLGSYLRPLYLNSRHLIISSPAFYLGIAVGVDALARRLTRGHPTVTASPPRSARGLLYAPVLLLLSLPLVVGAVYALYNLYYVPAFAKDDHKAWVQYLKERLRPDDYLILVAPQAEKIVKYYAPEGLKWESLPHLGQTQDWQEFLDRESVLNAYRNHGRVWFLEIHQPVGDPKFAINKLLYKYGAPTDYVYFSAIASRITLQQFFYRGIELKPRFDPPDPTRIRFDQTLRLRGVTPPARIEAGGRSAIKLYWQVESKALYDISVSLRVVDADGKQWGQWDAAPVGNIYPITKWRRGYNYLDAHDVVVDAGAPPGTYFVEMNVYRAASHEPLTAKIADGTETTEPIRIAQIEVTRPTPAVNPKNLIFDQHLDIAFSNSLRFVGYDLEDRSTTPGSDVPLTLYFQLEQPPTTSALNGTVSLSAPWWQFWNRTQTITPFTLDLTNRQPGDIVQTRVGARVPGNASAGGYDLQLALDGLTPNTILPAHRVTFGDVNVEPIARSTNLPPIANLINARLGDSVEFLGYDLLTAPALNPNDPVRLKLYWRALKPMDTSYKVFTHLLSTDNQVRGQQDKLPLDGARPTSSWAAGEIFTDSYEFNVAPDAPPGAYQIEIGMYNPTDFARLPAFDANGSPTGDRILFGDLRVQ